MSVTLSVTEKRIVIGNLWKHSNGSHKNRKQFYLTVNTYIIRESYTFGVHKLETKKNVSVILSRKSRLY